jgi:zinc/manganese transport system permease protein
VSASPVLVPMLSTLFALTAMLGGIMLALGGSVPISPYVTTISFLIYLACRAWAAHHNRQARSLAHRSSS